MTKQILTLTDGAAHRIQDIIAQRGKETLGVRIGVRTRGCSGMAYTLEFTDVEHPGDEVVRDKGVVVYVEPKAVLFLIGTEMDFVDQDLQSGFTFKNPNEKGRCGCGESFHV